MSQDQPVAEGTSADWSGRSNRLEDVRNHPAFESMPTGQTNWPVVAFLLSTPVLSVILGITYTLQYGFTGVDLGILVGMYLACGLSITGGYHRLFSHKAYEAHPLVQWFFLAFGAGAIQNSAIEWCSDHRYHHQFTDRQGDPYNINKGFFWAHMGWIFCRYQTNRPFKNSPDLKANPRIQFQSRFYWPMAVFFGFAVPTLLGWLLADRPFAGFLWGGLIRMVLTHHCTNLINSYAHTFGTRRYDLKATAADSPVLAMLSLGEGYHSFHHAFQADYRNGIRWYQWDPTKWLIRGLSAVGLTHHLRRTPQDRIDERLRIAQEDGLVRSPQVVESTLN